MASRYSIILSFILATLLAVGGVELFYGSLIKKLAKNATITTQLDTTQPDTNKTPPRAVVTNHPQKKPGGKEDYSIISRRSLFGKIKATTSSKPAVQEETVLTTTSLNLALLGTIGGKDNDQRAIIRDKSDKKQDIYYKGDAIANALIKEILRGKIILTVNGKDEILLMQESKSPPSTGAPKNYAMPEVVRTPKRHIAATEDLEEEMATEEELDMEEDNEPIEDLPPATIPKRRMTLKPKSLQVTEP